MKPIRYGPETLHIALLSLPQKDLITQIDEIVKEHYSSYKKDIARYSDHMDEEWDHLYKPLQYCLLGNYDIALISLINNHKFSQRQITSHEPNAFQVITGACPLIDDQFSLKEFFRKREQKAEPFIGITNIKLNNELLIGNGAFFLHPVMDLLDRTLKKEFKGENEKDLAYFIQQSYSWFEITLVTFSNDIETISDVLAGLRRLKLQDLPVEERATLEQNSLYQTHPEDVSGRNPHLFADTHSYFGFHSNLVRGIGDKQVGDQPLEMQIEWEIKPGHFVDLRDELSRVEAGGIQVFRGPGHILTGKMDYTIQPVDKKFSGYLALLAHFRTGDKLIAYIRRIKTKVLLASPTSLLIANTGTEDPAEFKRLIYTHFLRGLPRHGELNDDLTTLKISRNVRNKINKIYYNYRNGIQDPILFTYFLDFKLFIQGLTEMIRLEAQQYWAVFTLEKQLTQLEKRSVHELEQVLIKMIEVFEEGYNTRMLNCHHFEDINDFDLDFNSSIQQMLSTYNTLAAHISLAFYDRGMHGPVVQLCQKNTVSNYVSINYDVYHLISPEFVFFTLIKEVLNKYIYANEKLTPNPIRSIIKELEEEVKAGKLRGLFEDDLISFEYYFLDSVKFIHSCNLDEDLYVYWFWTWNLQNASLFDKIGMVNEENFKNELIRLFFVLKLFGTDIQELECPLADLAHLWERHSRSISERIDEFFAKSNHIHRFKYAILEIFKYPDVGEEYLNGVSKEISEEKVEGMLGQLNIHLIPKENLELWESEGNGNRILNYWGYALYRHKGIVEKLSKGYPVYEDAGSGHQLAFISALMYSYLRIIFDRNKKVRILRRDALIGRPLTVFIRAEKEEFLYSADPFGGVYFANNKRANEYFELRNATLQSLWHCGLLMKKDIYFYEGEQQRTHPVVG
jgi:hypothetical protein